MSDGPTARWWTRGIALLLMLVALGNLGRAAMALHYARALPDLPLTVPWAYLVGMGGFWGVALMACAVGLYLRRPWGRPAALVGATLYQAHVWLNHLLFDASDYARQTWPRDLALSLLFLLVVWGVLCWPGSGWGTICRRFCALTLPLCPGRGKKGGGGGHLHRPPQTPP